MTRRLFALSVGPSTATTAKFLCGLIETAGGVVEQFPADGHGGRRLEAEIRAGRFEGVVDLTLTEVAAEVAGVSGSAGPDRLTAAAMAGVPQVIVLGGLDTVGDPPRRTTPQECDRIGLDIAQKACACRGPVALVVPRGGLSSVDVPGGAGWDPTANDALFQSLQNWLYGVEVIELAENLKEPAASNVIVSTLLRLTDATGLPGSSLDSQRWPGEPRH